MTVIEYASTESAENAVMALKLKPERVIFIGDDEARTAASAAVCKAFFEKRGIFTQVESVRADYASIFEFADALDDMIGEYGECVFDVTNGDPSYLAATGVLCDRYRDIQRPFSVMRMDIPTGTVKFCIRGDMPDDNTPEQIGVEDVIVLNGGVVYYDNIKGRDDGTHVWDLDGEFKPEFEELCKLFFDLKPGQWNALCLSLESFCRVARNHNDLYYSESIPHLTERKRLSPKMELNPNNVKRILGKLSERGLVTGYSVTNDIISFRFISDSVRRCCTKAGQVLELIVYDRFRSSERNGVRVYNDCMTGVALDWDGTVHSREEMSLDTKNEVDVIAMHNMESVFVSCKSGAFDVNELYKLHSVAERFGTGCAKKILIIPYISNNDEALVTIRTRALDMNIRIITFMTNEHGRMKCDFSKVNKAIRTLFD